MTSLKDDINYLQLKWLEFGKNRMPRGTMLHLIQMVSERHNIHFNDILLLIEGYEI